MTDPIPSQPVILFDGVCNLCNRSVQFIIRHDPGKRFLFAPLQSRKAQAWLTAASAAGESDRSIILLYEGKVYKRSTAALRIAGQLKGPVKCLYLFLAVPRFIRDAVYDWIAHNRYRWFGRQAECMMPTPETRSRFITD